MIAGALIRRWGSGLSGIEFDHAGPGGPASGSSGELAVRVRNGDSAALETLCVRYRARLLKWAHGRLPAWARERMATEDLVQETLLGLTRRIPGIDIEESGAMEAYLRVALGNRLKDEMRRARRRPAAASLPEDEIDDGPSPLEQAIGRETFARYEASLAALTPADRGLVIARLELEMGYAQIAESTGRRSPDAVRMAVSRALVRLAEEMASRG